MHDGQPDWDFWIFVMTLIGLAIQIITQLR